MDNSLDLEYFSHNLTIKLLGLYGRNIFVPNKSGGSETYQNIITSSSSSSKAILILFVRYSQEMMWYPDNTDTITWLSQFRSLITTHQSRTRTNGTRLTPEVLYPDHSRLLRELKSTKNSRYTYVHNNFTYWTLFAFIRPASIL